MYKTGPRGPKVRGLGCRLGRCIRRRPQDAMHPVSREKERHRGMKVRGLGCHLGRCKRRRSQDTMHPVSRGKERRRGMKGSRSRLPPRSVQMTASTGRHAPRLARKRTPQIHASNYGSLGCEKGWHVLK